MNDPTRRIDETREMPSGSFSETMDSSSGDTRGDVGPIDEQSLPVELGRYLIEEVLGRGGMGAVYRARDKQLDRDVALKVPRFKSGESDTAIKRFYREARAAATLSHPNLCAIYDVAEIDGVHCIAMAYIKGRPLSDYIDVDKPPDAKAAATTIYKVALAMEEAHQSGILHRDLKPANIMVDKRKEPIVMDFGLACQSDGVDESRLTQAGTLLGSPAYMSPEQLKGNPNEIGPASDQYSLGVVLYELLCGRLPFEHASSTITLLSNILTESPKPLASVRQGLDERLLAIVDRAMAKQPGDRFESMKAMSAELAKFIRTRSSKKSGATTPGLQTVAKSLPTPKTVVSKPAKNTVATPANAPVQDNPFESISLGPAASAPVTQFRGARAPRKSFLGSLPPIAMVAAVSAIIIPVLGVVVWTGMSRLTDDSSTESIEDVVAAETQDLEASDAARTDPIATDSSLEPEQDVLQGIPPSQSNSSDEGPTRARRRVDPDGTRPPVSAQQRVFANQLLREFDRDRDNQLTADEIPEPEWARMMQADRNHDGILDRAELEDAARPTDGPPIGRPGPPRFFDERGEGPRFGDPRPNRGGPGPGPGQGRRRTPIGSLGEP
ncbi:MAG: protein kinase [Planctomycetota bacterium]